MAIYSVLFCFVGQTAQLVGSQLPDQGSNPGHNSESPASQPLGHRGTPVAISSDCAIALTCLHLSLGWEPFQGRGGALFTFVRPGPPTGKPRGTQLCSFHWRPLSFSVTQPPPNSRCLEDDRQETPWMTLGCVTGSVSPALETLLASFCLS